MSNVELFHYLLLLICGAGALTWLAERVSIPPAVVLLVGGCVVAVAGKRVPDMDPALLLAAVLPPLLMSSGFYTAWKEFRHELASIASLALGAVAFTTVAVALAVHAANPALPWAACFTLGAIVSPPDAVAAKAILQRHPLPARLVAVLEGESLVNDASGLLLYQMAVSAALAVTITTAGATALFFSLTLIGIVTGLVCGHAMCWVLQRVREPMLGIVVTFAMAWGSYGIAEAVHGSGVLSVVTCGLVLGVRQHRVFGADLRIKAKATWEAVVFVLDALVFILIGLALHAILAREPGRRGADGRPARRAAGDGRRDRRTRRLGVRRDVAARAAARAARRPSAVVVARGRRARLVGHARRREPRRRDRAAGRFSRARPDPVQHVPADHRDAGGPGRHARAADPRAEAAPRRAPHDVRARGARARSARRSPRSMRADRTATASSARRASGCSPNTATASRSTSAPTATARSRRRCARGCWASSSRWSACRAMRCSRCIATAASTTPCCTA
jgi:NhaP-type Na+/H+ or K+/H+ antiporter